jgi:hypothetical protein
MSALTISGAIVRAASQATLTDTKIKTKENMGHPNSFWLAERRDRGDYAVRGSCHLAMTGSGPPCDVPPCPTYARPGDAEPALSDARREGCPQAHSWALRKAAIDARRNVRLAIRILRELIG